MIYLTKELFNFFSSSKILKIIIIFTLFFTLSININCSGSKGAKIINAPFSMDGTIDTTFANNGTFLLQTNPEDGLDLSTRPIQVLVDSEDRIMLLMDDNKTGPGTDVDVLALRLLPDGQLDTSFDNEGALWITDVRTMYYGSIPGVIPYDSPSHIEFGPDGNLLITVTSLSPYNDYDQFTLKYSPSGQLMTDYGTDGYHLFISKTDYDEECEGVQAQQSVFDSNSNQFVAGTMCHSCDTMYIRAILPDGSADLSFGNQSVVAHKNTMAPGIFGSHVATNIHLTSSGALFIIGFSHNGTDYDAIIWKYHTQGNPIATFGENGVLQIDNGANEFFTTSAMDSNGNIYVGGSMNNQAGNTDWVLYKYNVNGDPVSEFGTNGILYLDGQDLGMEADVDNSIVQIVIDPNDIPYVFGDVNQATGSKIAFIRLDPQTGAVDTSFAQSGANIIDGTGRTPIGMSLNNEGTAMYLLNKNTQDGTPKTELIKFR